MQVDYWYLLVLASLPHDIQSSSILSVSPKSGPFLPGVPRLVEKTRRGRRRGIAGGLQDLPGLLERLQAMKIAKLGHTVDIVRHHQLVTVGNYTDYTVNSNGIITG